MDNVVNVDDVEEEIMVEGRWGHAWKVLTPAMERAGGTLGVNQTRVPPGCAAVPFHWHARADEVFFVLSGRGVLRYGEEVRELRRGDCISCPAGTQTAHQIANPFDEDLVYLAIGANDPHEVCGYPDSDKVMVRFVKRIGRFEKTDYMAGEPEVPKVFEMLET